MYAVDLTDMSNEQFIHGYRLGIVVIGRNEGELLRRCLMSLSGPDEAARLYVDSGSSDASVELARSMGIDVHELTPSTAFSPARGRREGVEVLLARYPDLEFIQFVDGDCELEQGWIEDAVEYLKKADDVGIVCGRLREKYPERSIYNRLNSLQWKRPTGDIDSCGGIFMVRTPAYKAAGGFDARLMTREEQDLCDRIRGQGLKVRRIPRGMAAHDSGFDCFNQWWRRAVWGGYGDAVQIASQSAGGLSRQHIHRVRRYLTWPILVPLIAILGIIGAVWLPPLLILTLSCLLAYGILFLRLAIGRLRAGDSIRIAAIYSVFSLIRKFACGYGFALHFLQKMRGSVQHPDAHGTSRTP